MATADESGGGEHKVPASDRGLPLATALRGHRDAVLCVQAHDELRRLASSSEDRTVRLWDLRTDKTVQSVVGFEDAVNCVCFAPQNDHLLYAACGNKISCYDLRTAQVILRQSVYEYAANEDEINQIAVHPKSGYLAACDDSGQIKILDTNIEAVAKGHSNPVFKTLRNGHNNICSCVAFRPNSSWDVYTGGMDSKLLAWDFSRGRPTTTFDFAALRTAVNTSAPGSAAGQLVNPPFVHSLCASADGGAVAVALGDSSVQLIDVRLAAEGDSTRSSAASTKGRGKAKGKAKTKAANGAQSGASSRDADDDKKEPGERMHSPGMLSIDDAHHAMVAHVHFASFDPRVLISASNDLQIMFWDVSPFYTLKPKKPITPVATSLFAERQEGQGGHDGASSYALPLLLRVSHQHKVNWLATDRSPSLYIADCSPVITRLHIS